MLGTTEELQTRWSSGYREDNEDVAEHAGKVQQQAGGVSVKEMNTGRIISMGNGNECRIIINNKNNLLQNVLLLQ